MMADFDAVAFGQEWAARWNARDLEAVLRHFDEDVVFTSPVAQRIGFSEDGTVKGKPELRRYWTAALSKNPNLHFRVLSVFRGTDTIVIVYKNQDGIDRAEVLTFRGGLVVEGHGAFGVC